MSAPDHAPLAADQWEDSARGLKVQISPKLLSRLALEALEAYKALPHRGLEIGGLLLGRRETAAGATAIHVESSKPVECEHRSGPSYRLSEADRERFGKSLEENPEAVGMYRSQTRAEGFAAGGEDIELLQRFFPGEHGVFVLIQPAVQKAGLLLPSGDHLSLAVEFPAVPEFLSALTAENPQNAHAEPARASTSESAPPPPAQLPADRLTVRRWLLFAAVAVLGAAAGFAIVNYRSRAEAPESAQAAPADAEHFDLQIQWAGPALRLHWDRNSRLVQLAHGGAVYITDGNRQSSINLGSAELRSGVLVYRPESSNVAFRVDLFAADHTITEWIRAISGAGETDAVAFRQPAEPPEKVEPAPALQRPVTERSSAARTIAQPRTATPARRHFTPAGTRPAAIAMAEPPAVSSIPAAKQPPLDSLIAPGIAAPPLRPGPGDAPGSGGVVVSAEPVRVSGMNRFFGKVFGRKRPEAVVPPQPVHQEKPAVRAGLKRPVTMDVKVYVTESGKVDYAELLSKADGGNRELAAAAVFAARRWNFTPAQVDGEKAASEVVLHFRFSPAAK